MKLSRRTLRKLILREVKILVENDNLGQSVTDLHPAVVELKKAVKRQGFDIIPIEHGLENMPRGVAPPIIKIGLKGAVGPDQLSRLRDVGLELQRKYDVNFGYISEGLEGIPDMFGGGLQYVSVYATFVNDANRSELEPFEDLTGREAEARMLGYGC